MAKNNSDNIFVSKLVYNKVCQYADRLVLKEMKEKK